MLGFMIALVAGIALAIGIVHVRTLDRSLMPWLIASQAMPVLAIAPMVVVVLGNVGLTGVLPKALIAGWLSFFPITAGMVKGLRSLRRDAARPAAHLQRHRHRRSSPNSAGPHRWPSCSRR